jgi:hypothetical protein
MKNVIYYLLVAYAFTSALSSCQKEEPTKQASKNAAEAEFRLGSAKKWLVSDIKFNDTYIVKDKILLDSSEVDLVEWMIFDTKNKTIEAKYPSEVLTTFFDYIIENDTFKVIHKDGEEEVMTIKSGSVFEDHFSLSAVYGVDKLEAKLVKQ